MRYIAHFELPFKTAALIAEDLETAAFFEQIVQKINNQEDIQPLITTKNY